jgi:hypothetical protein
MVINIVMALNGLIMIMNGVGIVILIINVGNPGCHKQLPFGDGWNPSHKNGDDLGMIYYWVYHILGKTNRWGID